MGRLKCLNIMLSTHVLSGFNWRQKSQLGILGLLLTVVWKHHLDVQWQLWAMTQCWTPSENRAENNYLVLSCQCESFVNSVILGAVLLSLYKNVVEKKQEKWQKGQLKSQGVLDLWEEMEKTVLFQLGEKKLRCWWLSECRIVAH